MPKSPNVQRFLDAVTGDPLVGVHADRRCVNPPVGCGRPIEGFRDTLSAREYEITGMCQNCQDNFEAENPEE